MLRVRKQKYPPERFARLTEIKWRQPELWEIFTFSINDEEYMYGRVIHMSPKFDSSEANPNENLLIYIYKPVSKIKKEIPELKKEDLLVTTIAWREIWQRWHFETLEQRELSEKDFYSPICFNYDHLMWDNFRDEKGKILDKEYYPCLRAWLPNIHWVENGILKALWEKVS